jgi:GT2 family glycosyltransferase
MKGSEVTGYSQESELISVLAVIVLYKLDSQNSASFQTLRAAMEQMPSQRQRFKILLYDNTPGAVTPHALSEGVQYELSSSNSGVSKAYNRALEIAESENFDWLLTLDQDTRLPPAFLAKICEVISRCESSPEIAAIVPQLEERGKQLSPEYFMFDAIPQYVPRGFVGVSPFRKTSAFNSASTLRVSALREIGGYNPLFWLDYSDAYIYSRLNASGKKIYVAGDIQVEHEFSGTDKRRRITPERYETIVKAGSAFWDTEMGWFAGLDHTARLLLRLYKHWKRRDDLELRKITMKMLAQRLTQSRSRRIAEWKAEMESR